MYIYLAGHAVEQGQHFADRVYSLSIQHGQSTASSAGCYTILPCRSLVPMTVSGYLTQEID